MATKLHTWLEQAKAKHSEAKPAAKGQSKGQPSKKQKSESASGSDGVRKAVIAVGDYVQEVGRWVGVFQGGLMTAAVFKKRSGFEHSMSITNEFAQNDDAHQMAWAALLEDLVCLTVSKELQPSIALFKQFLNLDPSDWQQQVNFCRVCLTHDKERIKIQFWVDPKLDRLAEAVCAICSSFDAVVYHNPPPRSKRCRLAIRSVEAIR